MDVLYKLGEIVLGKVSSIQPYGAFIEFENNAHGLLHISEISDGFVRKIEDFAKIGETIRVKIIGIEDKSNFYKVSIKRISERERQVIRKPLGPTQKKRSGVISKPEDFQALKDKIPNWIDQALKEEKSDD